jgi:hypothetical protein
VERERVAGVTRSFPLSADSGQPKGHMTLDTKTTIYLGIDRQNDALHVLIPKDFKFDIIELYLSDPDPDCTDAAEFKLLAEEMNGFRFDI